MAKEKNKDVKKKVAVNGKSIASKSASVVQEKALKKANKPEKQIKVTQIKSAIGIQIDQKRTLSGLKLNKMYRVAILEDTDAVRGMINKVKHLVKVEKL